jgi:hypothetical protein
VERQSARSAETIAFMEILVVPLGLGGCGGYGAWARGVAEENRKDKELSAKGAEVAQRTLRKAAIELR